MNYTRRRLFSSGGKTAGRLVGGSIVAAGVGGAAYVQFVDPNLPQKWFGSQVTYELCCKLISRSFETAEVPKTQQTKSLADNAARLRAGNTSDLKKFRNFALLVIFSINFDFQRLLSVVFFERKLLL